MPAVKPHHSSVHYDNTRYDAVNKRRAQNLHLCFLCLKGSHRNGSCPKKTG